MAFLSKTLDFVLLSSRHAFAIVITAFALSAIPVVVAMVVGVLGMISGVILTVLFTLGSDPPLFGFVFGVVVTLAMALVTFVLPVLILVFTHALSGVIIMPFTLFIHSILTHSRINSHIVAITAYGVMGIVIGLGIGAATHLVVVVSKWQISQSPWFLISAYGVGVFLGVLATTIYGSVLFITAVVQAGIRHVVRVVRSEKQLIPAGG